MQVYRYDICHMSTLPDVQKDGLYYWAPGLQVQHQNVPAGSGTILPPWLNDGRKKIPPSCKPHKKPKPSWGWFCLNFCAIWRSHVSCPLQHAPGSWACQPPLQKSPPTAWLWDKRRALASANKECEGSLERRRVRCQAISMESDASFTFCCQVFGSLDLLTSLSSTESRNSPVLKNIGKQDPHEILVCPAGF